MTAPIRTVDTLVEQGFALPEDAAALQRVADRYALAITPDIAALIDREDPADPIALQFVPSPAELDTTPEERADPIGDEVHSPCEGIVHRYPDRVLLKLVHICPVYCRFCFRRETVGPGKSDALGADALKAALAYVAAHPEIWEVIVTGGDPLILSPRRIAEVTRALSGIPHVRVVRWHTRVPVVAPERVDAGTVAALRAFSGTTYVALHANHPREFTPASKEAIARIVDGGIAMVSQSVLLKGVNDDVETLAALMRAFAEHRVKPYYLHHGDLAPGTSHFRTTVAEGRALMKALRGRVSGLCQPTYILDIPGGHGKSPLTADYVGDETVEDFRGTRHAYPGCSG